LLLAPCSDRARQLSSPGLEEELECERDGSKKLLVLSSYLATGKGRMWER